MSLLKKALNYREKFLNEHLIGSSPGLFKRVFLILKDNESIKNNNVELTEDNVQDDTLIYFEIINKISTEISSLPLEKNVYIKINDIISKNFNFAKSVLLIFSPDDLKFKYWSGKNIDEETKSRMNFDLSYNEIYNNLASQNFYFVQSKDQKFNNFKNILSKNDYRESDFFLFIPFIFAYHIIGIFLILKIKNNKIPNNRLIESLQIIGKLNGSLIYNIFQQEKLFDVKKSENKEKNDFTNNNDNKTNETSYINDFTKLISYINNIIFNNKDKNHSIINLKFLNILDNSDFSLIDFHSDIQFIIMNIIGTEGYVEIFEDMNIFIVLSSKNKEEADQIINKIIEEIKKIFIEITTEFIPELDYHILTYPVDSTNGEKLINMIKDL